eukprot:CAMPEP_0196812970 /NCGR_PEP_ID=MMETSP1362-20130617/32703_1 /TAXON_ID=163516 /ORGANISM="Leptocylindrus danicus, Strain CCMP1856" /LENGTH=608 /DNA_ID=CAMNT_0042188945 /DNA_START=120 /DNA_END=1946 /DNA_ORIENTATION=+
MINDGFTAGFVTSTVIWFSFMMLLSVAGEIIDDEDEDDVTNRNRNHVGELPRKILERIRRYSSKQPWPWNKPNGTPKKVRPTLRSSSMFENVDDGKSGLCIGNIFGLDVGGTLAKLVYFEQLHASDTHSSMHAASSGIRVDDKELSSECNKHRRFSSTIVRGNGNNGSTENGNGSIPHLNGNGKPSQPKRSCSCPAERPSVKKVASCMDFTRSFKHEEALRNFYEFAGRHDTYGETGVKEKHLSFKSRELGGEFHFIRFETRNMDSALRLIKTNNLHVNIREMGATGGGAHKYADDWEKALGIEMNKQEELEAMVVGMQFVLSSVVGECYTFKPRDEELPRRKTSISSETMDGPVDDWWWSRKVKRDAATDNASYPYLLVTIGTGVSILRIDGPRKHTRVSGSTIGGGTYYGLCRLLTTVDNFQDVLDLAKEGDPTKVDMMVGDIYGPHSDALEKLGLPANIVASSFGKLVAKHDPADGVTEEDLARALLLMITNNIGQVAYLNACLYKTPRIYFVGNFLRHNNLSARRLAYAIDYWSGGKMEALFLEHEGYFGALGAFLLNQEQRNGQPVFTGGDSSANDGMKSIAQTLLQRAHETLQLRTKSMSSS